MILSIFLIEFFTMRRVMKISASVVIFVFLIGALLAEWLLADLPSIDNLSAHQQPPSLRFTDRYGRLLYEVLPQSGGRHTFVPLKRIPLYLRQATIATEDQSFYHHPGVDLWGMLRAMWINIRGGRTLAGGSTITQQVARNLLLGEEERSERSLRRKLREAILAWELTRHYSKDEILELYLNQTYYGGMAYGVEAAAQTFFGKSVDQLDLAEAALLAGLPQAPAVYNPYTDMQAAKQRQEVVLSLMEEAGYITAEQHALAQMERLVFADTPYPIEAPHFVLMARQELDRLFAPDQVFASGGLVVRTTLDLDWQHQAESAVQQQLEKLQQLTRGLSHNVNNAALVALDVHSGDVLALVGSVDYFDASIAGAINMALAPRQPGSALKPLIYAVALDPQFPHGPWSAATMILDVRTAFLTREGKAYVPENYDRQEHGPVLLRQALASSLNIPAVITLDHVGMEALIDLAHRLGITTFGDPYLYDLSLALGGGEVRLLELSAAYGAFANGGYRLTPRLILEVTSATGEVLYQAEPMPQVRVLDERVAWLINDILSDDEARRLGFGEHSVLQLDRPAAVKTGTTSNFHDNWTIGYTPDLVVGVWSGNSDYQPMWEINGLTGAAPIWHQFMRTVLSGAPIKDFPQPKDMLRVEICSLSGLLPTDACPYRRWEWFIPGTQPTTQDRFYQWVEVDIRTGALANAQTQPQYISRRVALDLPAQAHPWARAHNLLLLQDLMQLTSLSITNEAELIIITPAPGAHYLINPHLDASTQRILIEASAGSGITQVSFWLDGEMLAVLTSAPYRIWWQLQPGEHHIWAEAVNANGERLHSAVVTIEVEVR